MHEHLTGEIKFHLGFSASEILPISAAKVIEIQQARKLQATLEGCNPKLRPLTDLLTVVKCRATSVAKKG